MCDFSIVKDDPSATSNVNHQARPSISCRDWNAGPFWIKPSLYYQDHRTQSTWATPVVTDQSDNRAWNLGAACRGVSTMMLSTFMYCKEHSTDPCVQFPRKWEDPARAQNKYMYLGCWWSDSSSLHLLSLWTKGVFRCSAFFFCRIMHLIWDAPKS